MSAFVIRNQIRSTEHRRPFTRHDAAKDGLWKIDGRRQVIYPKAELPPRDRIRAAQDIAGSGFQNASQPTS
jgi:hypothetical protein